MPGNRRIVCEGVADSGHLLRFKRSGRGKGYQRLGDRRCPYQHRTRRVEKGPYPDALVLCRESRLDHMSGDCVGSSLAGLLGVLFCPSVWLLLLLTWIWHPIKVRLRERPGIATRCRITPIPPFKADYLLSLTARANILYRSYEVCQVLWDKTRSTV